MAPETADDINQAAAEWVARADRGLTATEDAALSAWLASDRRREGAYLRMTAVLFSAEGARAEASETPARRGFRASRRLWLGAGIAAAVVGVVSLALLERPEQLDTRRGEKRVVALDDGSVITLNTATRLRVHYTAGRRSITLERGEALFDVAKDPDRPFVVRAGSTEVRAVGTSFTVGQLADQPVQILVREGVVEVSERRSDRRRPMRIAANTRAVVAHDAVPMVIAKVEPAEVGRVLAWRQGRLVFAGESLSSAVAQFARYSDVRIVVADPDLAGRGVAGVFEANDPVGFAQAAALSLNARVEVREGEVLILH
ncbi:MAG: FecR domain-containing protein [Caulobacter sp.]